MGGACDSRFFFWFKTAIVFSSVFFVLKQEKQCFKGSQKIQNPPMGLRATEGAVRTMPRA